jgi:hypothetical protein
VIEVSGIGNRHDAAERPAFCCPLRNGLARPSTRSRYLVWGKAQLQQFEHALLARGGDIGSDFSRSLYALINDGDSLSVH